MFQSNSNFEILPGSSFSTDFIYVLVFGLWGGAFYLSHLTSAEAAHLNCNFENGFFNVNDFGPWGNRFLLGPLYYHHLLVKLGGWLAVGGEGGGLRTGGAGVG